LITYVVTITNWDMKMKKLLLLAVLLAMSSTAAELRGSGDGAGIAKLTQAQIAASLPCITGTAVVFLEDSAVGDCNELGGGTANSDCYCNDAGTAYEPGSSVSGASHPVSDATSIIEDDAAPANELTITLDALTATRDWTAPDEDVAIHDSQTDHEERYGIFNVLDYGAIPDDAIDDTDEIKAAWVACSASGQGGILSFQEGKYNLSDTFPVDGIGIDLTTEGNVAGCDFIGVSPTNTRTTFRWTGTDGVGKAIYWDGGIAAEFMSFRGLEFRNDVGYDYPDVWLYAKGLDKFSIVEFVRFSGHIGIQIAGYVNVQWNQIRCDGTKWCFDVIANGGFLRNLAIDQFTMDVTGSASHNWDGQIHGFMNLRCETSQCDSLNLGSIQVTNGRSESNSNDYQDGFRFFNFDKDEAGGANVDVYLSGIAAQHGDATGSVTMNQPCMLGLFDTAGGGTSSRYSPQIVNSGLSISDILCGDWGSNFEIASFDGTVESRDMKIGGRLLDSYLPNALAPALLISQTNEGPAFVIVNRSSTEGKVVSEEAWSFWVEGDGDIQIDTNTCDDSNSDGVCDTDGTTRFGPDIKIEFRASTMDVLGADVRIKPPEGQSVSGGDVLANIDDCIGTVGNGRACTLGIYKFRGIPAVAKSVVNTIANGTVNGTFEATAATCEPIGASGSEVDNTTYARKGVSSYWFTFDSAVLAGEGIDCDITVPASGDFDSFGIWMRSNTAITDSTDLELVLLAGATPVATEPVPVFTNNPGRDVWRWIEIDVSADCAAGCASVDGFKIQATSTTPETLNNDEFGFDNGALWLSSTEDAIGDNLYVDGVFSATSHPAAYGAPTELVEWTDYIINYTGSNEDYIPLTDQSAAGLWVELLHANQ